jgi:hypothetical protein
MRIWMLRRFIWVLEVGEGELRVVWGYGGHKSEITDEFKFEHSALPHLSITHKYVEVLRGLALEIQL